MTIPHAVLRIVHSEIGPHRFDFCVEGQSVEIVLFQLADLNVEYTRHQLRSHPPSPLLFTLLILERRRGLGLSSQRRDKEEHSHDDSARCTPHCALRDRTASI